MSPTEGILLSVLNGKGMTHFFVYLLFYRYFEMSFGSAVFSTTFAVLKNWFKVSSPAYFFMVNRKRNVFVS